MPDLPREMIAPHRRPSHQIRIGQITVVRLQNVIPKIHLSLQNIFRIQGVPLFSCERLCSADGRDPYFPEC
jgi:hypothetical protein